MPNNINPEDVIWDEEGITWDTPTPTPTLMERAKERLPEAISGTARLGMAGLAGPVKQAALAAEPTMGRPALEIGGALAGAALTAPGNIPAPGLASATGAGLGYAGGRRIADYLDVQAGRRDPQTPTQALGATARDVPVGAAMELGGPILGKAMGGVGKVFKGIEKLEDIIDKGISKGIRPSVAGKATHGAVKAYKGKAKEAVKSIIANKENLNLVDKSGQIIKRLPETVDEFAQAIESTKANVFKQYDDMAKTTEQASQIGAAPGIKVLESSKVVNLSKVADELEPILKDPVIADNFPEVAQYARNRIDVLRNRQFYTAEEAQRAIKVYNDSLKAFYQNPSYDSARKVTIDAGIVNNLRKGLDDAIENAVGPGYQQLKNQYGALKAIEKDVNRRAGVDARKATKGLIDFSDFFSGHEIIRGILTMRPEVIATGAFVKGLKGIYKKINDPNTIIKNMFIKAEKAMAPKVKKILPTMPQRAMGYEGVRGLPIAQPEAQGNTPTPQSNLLGSALGAMTPSAYAGEPPIAMAVPQQPLAGGQNEMPWVSEAATPLSSASAKAGVKSYFDRDYNNAIKSFGQAMTENPANAEEYTKAINMAMKEQKELGKFGAQGASQQKKTSPLSQPATAEPQTLGGIFNDLSFSRKVYAEEPAAPTLGSLKGEETPKLSVERQGIQAYLQGDYIKALRSFQQAMTENPANAEEYQTAIDQILDEMTKIEEEKTRRDQMKKERQYNLGSIGRVGRALETQI